MGEFMDLSTHWGWALITISCVAFSTSYIFQNIKSALLANYLLVSTCDRTDQ